MSRYIKMRTVYSVILHAVYIFLIYVLQAGVFSRLPLLGLVPLLLPVSVAGIAMTEGLDAGGICGIFAGMLCDVAFNQPTMVYTIALTIVGLGIGYLSETVFARSFVSYLAANAIALIFVSIIQGFSLVFFRGQSVMPVMLSAVFQTVYSLVYSVPLYFAAKALGRFSVDA